VDHAVNPEPSFLGFLIWFNAQSAKVPSLLWLTVLAIEFLVLGR
jgi:hypothetical protein